MAALRADPELAQEPEWLTVLLARRGVDTPEAARRFLTPSVEHLHDPALLKGMEEALDCLLQARARGDKVAIVGDYDVDGVTSTALLTAVLGSCGLEVEPILPHRMREGYGFQPVHAERAHEHGCKLVVTADCGTTSTAAVARARELGLEVLITDHHLPGKDLPADVLQINPKQEGCSYPEPNLAAVGLAFKLAQAFAERCGVPVPLDSLLRMACLGTVADLVPLTGENRVITALGLRALDEVLGQGTRAVGLRALAQQSGVKPPMAAEDIGFRLGPRINAAGRLGSAEVALELLLSRDYGKALNLAQQLDGWNRERQAEEARVVEEARAQLLEQASAQDGMPSILVAWDASWHRGVVGIAAGRLAREFHRPALLLSLDEDQATGSGRSIPGIELHAFLEPWRGRLLRFGGHAQAIGLSASATELEALRDEWRQAAEGWAPELLRKRYEYELDLHVEDIDDRLFAQLRRLEPHGMANASPLVRVGPLQLTAEPRLLGEGGKHLSAMVKGATKGSKSGRGGRMLPVIAWGWGPRRDELDGRFEALGHLEHDDYRGGVRLRLRAARPC